MNSQGAIVQISPRIQYYVTILDTMYLYPIEDINIALASTTYTYTFDGVNIICPDIDNILGVYYDIFLQTTISQPIGNQGFSLGAQTSLQDLGKEIFFKLADGYTVVHWRLAKQLSPQTAPPIPIPGNSPAGTIGYVTVFNAYGNNRTGPLASILDSALLIRVG